MHNQLELVREVLGWGRGCLSPSEPNHNGATPLHIASSQGHAAIVRPPPPPPCFPAGCATGAGGDHGSAKM
jgi:hypothetical protein